MAITVLCRCSLIMWCQWPIVRYLGIIQIYFMTAKASLSCDDGERLETKAILNHNHQINDKDRRSIITVHRGCGENEQLNLQ